MIKLIPKYIVKNLDSPLYDCPYRYTLSTHSLIVGFTKWKGVY